MYQISPYANVANPSKKRVGGEDGKTQSKSMGYDILPQTQN